MDGNEQRSPKIRPWLNFLYLIQNRGNYLESLFFKMDIKKKKKSSHFCPWFPKKKMEKGITARPALHKVILSLSQSTKDFTINSIIHLLGLQFKKICYRKIQRD